MCMGFTEKHFSNLCSSPMKTVVLISCVSKKRSSKAKAKDIYKSALFKYSLAYAYTCHPERIFILSALHHVLDLETEIEPYEVTLSNVPKNRRKPGLKVLNPDEKREWGNTVISQLSNQFDLEHDKFIILAGQEYVKPISKNIKHKCLPLDGLSIGERLAFLKRHTCNE